MTTATGDLTSRVAKTVRCTCTPVRRLFSSLHGSYCARAVMPDALAAIIEATKAELDGGAGIEYSEARLPDDDPDSDPDA